MTKRKNSNRKKRPNHSFIQLHGHTRITIPPDIVRELEIVDGEIPLFIRNGSIFERDGRIKVKMTRETPKESVLD